MPRLPKFERLSLQAIKDTIATLRDRQAKGAEVEELASLLQPLFKGYWLSSPVLGPGQFLYRAVPWDERPSHIAQLKYPPAEKVVRYGRANRPGQSIFYCSVTREAPFFEIGVQPGTKVALSRWRIKDRLFVNNVGYTPAIFDRLASVRQTDAIFWHSSVSVEEGREQQITNDIVHAFLAEEFTRDTALADPNDYKLSVAIAERLLGNLVGHEDANNGEIPPLPEKFAGIIYPAMKMRANADNLALLPEFVDSHLELEQVEFIRVRDAKDFKYTITTLDYANRWEPDGNIVWQGAPPRWQVSPGDSMTIAVENGVWVGRDKFGNVVPFDSSPTTTAPTPYLTEFTNDFPTAFLIGDETTLTDENGSEFKLFSKLGFDLERKEIFLAFLLPSPDSAFHIMRHTVESADEIRKRLQKSAEDFSLNNSNDKWWEQFKFTGQMIFYCNATLDPLAKRQLEDLCHSRGQIFEWRGSQYLQAKFGS